MKLTAILAVRNESLHISRCCQHLADQGIDFAVIDNESTDNTRAIAESYRGRGLVAVVNHPYPGYYDWTGLLEHKQRIARELDSDWFMHVDADEIPESPHLGGAILAEISAADAAGYTAINFDEFVFLPETANDRHEGTDYVLTMNRYYFFSPRPGRLIRGWRRAPDVDLVGSGGHAASFNGCRVYPSNFALRHYIALSIEHLVRKYVLQRTYAPAELAKGWHGWRSQLTEAGIRLPSQNELCDLRHTADWDRSRPCQRHLFSS